MSLITDKVFFNALKSNAQLVQDVGGRIYSTAIPTPDDELLNEPVPYIIVTYDGLQNEGWTKDNSFEGNNDKVNIGILVAAEDRESLGVLMEDIRKTVIEYFEDTVGHVKEDYDLVPDEYSLTASAIQYDSLKPCFWQSLNYACDTNP